MDNIVFVFPPAHPPEIAEFIALGFTAIVIAISFLGSCFLMTVRLTDPEELSSLFLLAILLAFLDICQGMAYTVLYWVQPTCLLYQDDILCKLKFKTLSLFTAVTFMGAIYAINVLIFIKCRKMELKCVVTFFTEGLLLVATFLTTQGLYIEELPVPNTIGSTATPDTNTRVSIYRGYISEVLVAIGLFLMTIQVICNILTIVHIKRNFIQEDIEFRAKLLACLVVVSILTFINSMIPAFNSFIKADNIITSAALDYLLLLSFNIPAIAIPIAMITFLKPVRNNVKTIVKACLCCLKHAVTKLNSAT